MTKLVPDEDERMVDAVDAERPIMRTREEIERRAELFRREAHARRAYDRDYQRRLELAQRLAQG